MKRRLCSAVLLLLLAGTGWTDPTMTKDLIDREVALGKLQQQALGQITQHQYPEALRTYQDLEAQAKVMPLMDNPSPGTWQAAYDHIIRENLLAGIRGQGDVYSYLNRYVESTSAYSRALGMLSGRDDEVEEQAVLHKD
ncbi:MAG TPA: hypothetical protein VGO93_25555, partial [Candidatus Xenobia bacterium]